MGHCEECGRIERKLQRGLCSRCYHRKHRVKICQSCGRKISIYQKGLCKRCYLIKKDKKALGTYDLSMKPAKTTEEELRILRKSIISLVKSGKIKVLREDKRELSSHISREGKSVIVTILPWLQQNVHCPNCGGAVHYDNHLYPVCDRCSIVLESVEPVTLDIAGEKIAYRRFPN